MSVFIGAEWIFFFRVMFRFALFAIFGFQFYSSWWNIHNGTKWKISNEWIRDKGGVKKMRVQAKMKTHTHAHKVCKFNLLVIHSCE